MLEITTVVPLDAIGSAGVERRRERGRSVRRIQEHEIEPGRPSAAPPRVKVPADNSIALRDAAVLQVRLDQRDGAAIVLDERDVRRAAAERFDADGAGAGEAVEHPRAVEPLARAR